MIKKIIFCFVIFCISYTIYIHFFASNDYIENNVGQTNTIKIEKFIYNQNNEKYLDVIVGSSLSNSIILDSIPNMYSLSFGGLNAFAGLEVIKLSKIKPSNIYIELNKLYAGAENNFKEKIFSNLPYYLKKYVIITQTQNQPISKILLWVENFYLNIKYKDKNKDRNFLKFKELNTADTNVFNTLVNINYANYTQNIDTNFIIQNMSLLKDYVFYFSKMGTKVYFYETPIKKSLYNLPIPFLNRKYLFQFFPKQNYNYIPNDSATYFTTDGIHLNYDGAKKYTQYFLNQIKNSK